jgi:hypothetical protein
MVVAELIFYSYCVLWLQSRLYRRSKDAALGVDEGGGSPLFFGAGGGGCLIKAVDRFR